MSASAGVAYVQLLGQASAVVGGAHIPFVADKRYQMLAYLAYQEDWVSREQVAFLFWPDTDTQNAKQNLRGLLQRVRAMSWLSSLEADAYQLRWLVRTDVSALSEALASGFINDTLSLYQGPLLSGLEGNSETEFSVWLEVERQKLHGRWRAAVVESAVNPGQDGQSITLLRHLLQHDPLDEEALQRYMHITLLDGRPALGLTAYRTFTEQVRAELNMEPTSATSKLAQELASAESHREPIPAANAVPHEPESSKSSPSVSYRVPQPRTNPSLAVLKPATAFVGREQELTELARLLACENGRLVSITGAGGVGKTRLALQAAHKLQTNFTEGIWFASLESLSSAAAIPNAVAAALGTELQEGTEPLEQLVTYVGDKQMLLVMDNFEQLLDGTSVPQELLRGCPELRILVTSRERLNLEEEQLFPLDGLSVPDVPSIEQALEYDAVQLFISRAKRVQPSFSVGATELPHVLEVCRLVEGFPLGIELAAAWVRAVSVEDIASELGKSYDFLFSTSRSLADRHRSIRAAFEHSWNLLTGAQRDIAAKLSVFKGGFRKEAASFVAGASYAVLASLVDKSLLRVSRDGRYDLHALIHQYLAEKLFGHVNDETVAKDRHGKYYCAFLISREGEVNQKDDLEAISDEIENVKGALLWCVKARPQNLQRILEATGMFFGLRARYREEAEILAQALLLLDENDPAERRVFGEVLIRHADACYSLDNDMEACRRRIEHGLRLVSFPEDCIAVLLGRHVLAMVAYEACDYPSAKLARQELDELIVEVIDKAYLPPHLAFRAAAVNRNCLGHIERELGNYAQAEALFTESIQLNRQIGHDAHLAASLNDRGQLLFLMSRLTESLNVLHEGLKLATDLNLRNFALTSLERLVLVQVALGNHPSSVVSAQIAERLRAGEGDLSADDTALLRAVVGRLDAEGHTINDSTWIVP